MTQRQVTREVYIRPRLDNGNLARWSVRMDVVGKNRFTGRIKLTEAKSSTTAPLSKNQTPRGSRAGAKGGFELIERNGGQIHGKRARNSDLLGIIGPTKVGIWRPYTDAQHNTAATLSLIPLLHFLGKYQNEE